MKTERLLNLVLVLLYTRRPMSKAQIRRLVPQYGQSASTEAFERMFERDKDELRELGIPLVTQDIDPLHEDEPGYRIDQREYALPDIAFEPDELAVLGLASRTWAQASLAGPAAQALRKLRAAGVERDVDALIGIEPRLRTTEPAFDAVKDGVVRRAAALLLPAPRGGRGAGAARAAVVAHRGTAAGTSTPSTSTAAPRVFRLSHRGRRAHRRPAGGVRGARRPRARAHGRPRRHAADPAEPGGAARRGAGHSLRRRARTVGEVDEQWDLVDIDHHDLEDFAEEVAGYGADVVAEQPPELVDAVVRRLRGALAAHGGGGR